jgi:hypothetical protein
MGECPHEGDPMSFEEPQNHRGWFEVWRLLHPEWKKYQGEANEKLLLSAAQHYRSCQTAIDRAFHDVRASLVRTDGHDDSWDYEQEAQRKSQLEADLERNVVISEQDFQYAASLSPSQLVEAYRDATFARKYRKLIREFGFQPVPVFAARSQR